MIAGEPPHQLVAELVVVLALAAQARAVERDQAASARSCARRAASGRARTATTSRRRRRRASVSIDERAAAGRVRPRARPRRGGSGRSVGRLALAQQVLARRSTCTLRPQPAISCEVLAARAPRTRARRRSARQSSASALAPRSSRIARASSVMSIPTGHQVMQRPQPTQPELPNWSNQVASLCVIHWR